MPAELVVVGLGPGDAKYLTTEAIDALRTATQVYARTLKHPTVGKLPTIREVRSFDRLYEEVESFDQVYHRVAETLLELAEEGNELDQVVYAVPGSPTIGEQSVVILRESG
jgi:tetrapyrrole methylase family protein / MazG family protein